MASFIVKQLVGDKISAAKSAVPGGGEEKGSEPTEEEIQQAEELAAQRQREEDKRVEKHRQMEEEREAMRDGIREKYKIKKKEVFVMPMDTKKGPPGEGGPLPGQPKKGGDESMIPKDFDDFKNKMTNLPGTATEKAGELKEKCTIQ